MRIVMLITIALTAMIFTSAFTEVARTDRNFDRSVAANTQFIMGNANGFSAARFADPGY